MLTIARRAVALAAVLAVAIAAIVALDFPQPAQAQSDSASSVEGRIVVRPWVDDDGNLTRVEFGFRPGWGEDVRGGGDGPDDLFPTKRFLTQRLIDNSAGRWLRSSEILIPSAAGSEDGARGRIIARAEVDDDGRLTRIGFGFRPAWGEDVRGEQSGADDIFPTNRFLTRRLIDNSAGKWLRSSLITVPAERPVEAMEPTEPTEGEVGAGGGYATAEDGATITVPAGAAEPGAEISARVVAEPDRPAPPIWATDFHQLWDFEVEGGITEPVTLSLPVPQDGGAWSVVGYNGEAWELVPFVVEDGMIIATPDSLSWKGVVDFFKGAVSAGVDCASDLLECAEDVKDAIADCVARPKNCVEVTVGQVSDLADEFWGAAQEGTRIIVGAVETGYSYVKRAGEWVVELGSQMVQTLKSAFNRLSHWIAQTVPPLHCEDESDNVLATLNPGHLLLNICAEDEGEDEHRLRIKNMRRFWLQACPGPLTSPDLRRAPNLDVFGPLSNCALDGGTLLPSGREAEWLSQLESPTSIRATFSDSAALMTMVDWILAIVGASDISGKIGLAVDVLASLRELPAVSQLIEHAEAGRVGDMLQELGRILTSTHALKHISDVIAKAAPSLGVEFGGSVIQTALILVELGRVPLKLYDLLSAHYSESGTFAAASFERTDLLPPIGDGSLIVLDGTSDLYQAHVVDGSLFKRLILNSVVFDGYGFQLSDVQSVEQAEFDRWARTDLARLGDDAPVWRLFPDGGEGVRRLLDITAEQFEAAGFGWDAVISINQTEFDEWRAGPPITAAELGLEDTEDDETDDRPAVGTIRVVEPLAETPSGKAFSAVSLGAAHACGLRTSGEIVCWGSNNIGQTDAPSGRFSAVSAGGGHTCGLRPSGAIECWGYNDYGQTNAPDGTFSAVSAGYDHTCGVRTNSAVECWGRNTLIVTDIVQGSAMRGAHAGQADAPDGMFSAVSASENHTCGLRTSGEIVCWGSNFGPDEGLYTGQANPPSGTFRAVSAGTESTCGLRASGVLECWGFTSPDAPAGTFSAVSLGGLTGEAYDCGLRVSGAVVCWQVGSVPAPGGTFSAVSAGYYQACGLRTSGEIVCWGDLNDAVERDAPQVAPIVQADPIIQYVQVFTGERWFGYNCVGRDINGDGSPDLFFTDAAGNPLPNAAGINDECVKHGWPSRPLPDGPAVSSNVNEPPQCDDIADVGPLSPGEASERIRLSDYCRDPENESLRYAMKSSDDGVATASIGGGSLIVAAARTVGTATITLMASDPGGLTAQTSFRVTVRERAPEPPEIRVACPEYAEARRSFSCTVRNRGGAATSWDWSASGGAVGGRDETYSVWISSFGPHIVRLTASNAGGSDSDSTTVRLVATPPVSQYSRCGSDTIKVYWFDRANFRKHHVNLTGEEATRILGPSWWATIGHLSQPACDSWPSGAPVTAENYR